MVAEPVAHARPPPARSAPTQVPTRERAARSCGPPWVGIGRGQVGVQVGVQVDVGSAVGYMLQARRHFARGPALRAPRLSLNNPLVAARAVVVDATLVSKGKMEQHLVVNVDKDAIEVLRLAVAALDAAEAEGIWRNPRLEKRLDGFDTVAQVQVVLDHCALVGRLCCGQLEHRTRPPPFSKERRRPVLW